MSSMFFSYPKVFGICSFSLGILTPFLNDYLCPDMGHMTGNFSIKSDFTYQNDEN